MAKITYRKINKHAWLNDTFLYPYYKYLAKLVEYKNGRMDLHIDGSIIHHVEGKFVSEYNGWNYTIKKLLDRPLTLSQK